MQGKSIIALQFIGSFDRYLKNEKEKNYFLNENFQNIVRH